jgi:DNA transposition AAA+ family ATPase
VIEQLAREAQAELTPISRVDNETVILKTKAFEELRKIEDLARVELPHLRDEFRVEPE